MLESTILKKDDEGFFISAFRDKKASKDFIAKQVTRVMKAYPRQSNPYFNEELKVAISATGMTETQLVSAMDNVIRTDEWLSISKVVGFNNKVRLYTYNQVCYMVEHDLAHFGEFVIIDIADVPYRMRKSDIARYNIDVERLKTCINGKS